MPIILTPSGVAPTEYIAPADGDFVDSASVVGTVQPIINQTDRLTQRTLGARSLFEILHGVPTPARNHLFTFDVFSGWIQTDVSAAGDIWIPIGPFPRSQSDAPLFLAEVTINLMSPGHSVLPATMPQFSICGLYNLGMTVLDSAFVDTSASPGAYNAQHQINGVLSTPIEMNFLSSPAASLWIKFEGETGANATEGLTLLSIKTAFQETV